MISITAHGGVIQRFFEVLGIRGELPVGGKSMLTGYISTGGTGTQLMVMHPNQS